MLEEALALGQASPDRAADDEQQLAQVRIDLAFYLYVADEVEAARALLLAGIAALEPGPPTRGRAGLRWRLGWTYWRAGPPADAPPILRQAIEEARACGAQNVERMALHDLGVATDKLGDARESLALVEQSMALARAAADRPLLERCYINVPAIMYGNGETNERIMPLLREGLDRFRRSMDHEGACWIAQNTADFLVFEGRLGEALPYAEEAIVAVGAVGELGRLAVCLLQRAFVRLAMGDREGARADIGESRGAGSVVEPQSAIYVTLFDALFLWPDDPSAACRSIAEALHSPDVALTALLDTAPTAARMALRLGDAARLASSLAAYVAVAERCSGPVRGIERRWLEALLAEEAQAVSVLRTVAHEFEAIGYRLPAADCHADAALLAGRADLDPTADEADARRLYAACGAVPLLGELPEARWIEAAEATARPA